MTLSIQIRAEPALLYVTVNGPFTLIEAQKHLLTTLAAVDPQSSGKVLIDGRQVTGNPKDIERFFYGEFAAGAVARYRTQDGVRHEPQFAYVLHEPMLDPNRLGETVALNRGMWIKAFDDLEEALEWLGVDRTASAGGGDGDASSAR